MITKGFSHTVIGSREINQDAYLVSENHGLYAVADGVGGGLKGEVASQMAVKGFEILAPAEGALSPVVEKLQEQVYAEAISSLGEAVMGTTFTAIRINGNTATVVHVGDSRCYSFSGNHLKLLTEDHEAFDEVLQGPLLISYLGIQADIHPLKIQEETVAVQPGDLFLLCTDGLYRQIDEIRIASLIRSHAQSLEALPKLICEEAAKAEHSDNVTVVLAVVEGSDAPSIS